MVNIKHLEDGLFIEWIWFIAKDENLQIVRLLSEYSSTLVLRKSNLCMLNHRKNLMFHKISSHSTVRNNWMIMQFLNTFQRVLSFVRGYLETCQAVEKTFLMTVCCFYYQFKECSFNLNNPSLWLKREEDLAMGWVQFSNFLPWNARGVSGSMG